MNEFYYENQGSSTYLVYQVEDERNLDTLTLGMLTNNHIANLVPVVYTQQDAEQYLKYNVTSKVTVQQLWEDTISKKHLVGVLNGIVSAVLNAEEYMMDINLLVFDTNRIFVDITTGNTELICLPITETQDITPDMKAMFKEILFAAHLNPNENNDYFVKLINFVNSKTQFSVEACKAMLDEICGAVAETAQNVSQQVKHVQEVSTLTSTVPMQQPIEKNAVQRAENCQNTIHNSVQETSVLEAQLQQTRIPQTQLTQGFAVPDMAKKDNAIPEERKADNDEEKEISWFYLMSHYNKENATIYKEQKAKKKQDKENEKTLEKDKKKNKKEKKEKTESSSQLTGFAVPGSGISMAIPGQQVTSSTVQQQTQQASAPQRSDQTSQANSASAPQQSAQPPVSNLYAQQISGQLTQGRANFGETTVLNVGGIGETTVLTNVILQADAPKMPYLIRNKNNEKISLNKPVFRIGKEKSYVDYFIGDNTAISRSHADIITRDGNYYIRDNNSTNHTYINGTMIPSNEEIPIVDGTKIRLANEDFEFLF